MTVTVLLLRVRLLRSLRTTGAFSDFIHFTRHRYSVRLSFLSLCWDRIEFLPGLLALVHVTRCRLRYQTDRTPERTCPAVLKCTARTEFNSRKSHIWVWRDVSAGFWLLLIWRRSTSGSFRQNRRTFVALGYRRTTVLGR
jgi:hypothetical protein